MYDVYDKIKNIFYFIKFLSYKPVVSIDYVIINKSKFIFPINMNIFKKLYVWLLEEEHQKLKDYISTPKNDYD